MSNWTRRDLFEVGVAASIAAAGQGKAASLSQPDANAAGSADRGRLLTAKRETTGPASRIVLRPDRARIAADAEDVSMVTVEVVDARGRVFNGLGMAIVQAGRQPGEIRVEASSPGLESATLTVTCEPAQSRPAVA